MKTKLFLLSALAGAFAFQAAYGVRTDPQLLVGEMPAYSTEARTNGVQGTVKIEALIDEEGRVFAAEVIESLDPQLDAKALEAVRSWRFRPAMDDGVAVMQVVHIPVNFHLLDAEGEPAFRATEETTVSRS